MTTENTAAAPALAPDAYLIQLGFGPLIAQALFAAARLGVADHLAEKPLPVSELAARTQTHERSLYRILRSLAGVGVSNFLDEEEDEQEKQGQPALFS